MTTRVIGYVVYRKELKQLARKYPLVLDETEKLVRELIADERPGDKLQRVGYDAYKVRFANPSAGRGKSGGFRVIYYVQLVDRVVLLTLYSKTEQEDVPVERIRALIEGYLTSEAENKTGE